MNFLRRVNTGSMRKSVRRTPFPVSIMREYSSHFSSCWECSIHSSSVYAQYFPYCIFGLLGSFYSQSWTEVKI